MATKTITFTCVKGVCTPSNSNETINPGDVLNFVNNITTGQVILSGFSSNLFANGDTSVTIGASSSTPETIATNVTPDTYTYTITCDTCPGGNDEGDITVGK